MSVHQSQPVLRAGAPLARARAAAILLHGRGGTAREMLSLAAHFAGEQVALRAPQAAGNTWYPQRFLAPLEANEPHLGSALARIGEVLEEVGEGGLPADRVLLLGFSQGACLALEYAARQARRYGGVAGLSGGLIGPPGTTWQYGGSLAGTPVLLGCSDGDAHIPLERVRESNRVLEKLGGKVDERIYPGMEHTVNEDELEWVRALLLNLPD